MNWKPVKGYEGLYEVSDTGLIKALYKRVDTGKCHREWVEHILHTAEDSFGYLRTSLAKNGVNRTVKVHRIVAETFIPNPNNLPQVNHIDGNKQNNRVGNLEWCTQSQNMKHACQMGLKSLKGEKNPAHKLIKGDVEFIRKNYTPRHHELGTIGLAKRFGVHRKTISRIITQSHWKEGDATCQK